MTLAARGARTVRAAIRTAEPDAGAVNEGSDKDEAATSTARRAYAASDLSHDPKAATSAVRHMRTARGIEEETDNAGAAADPKAVTSAARSAYGASGRTHGQA